MTPPPYRAEPGHWFLRGVQSAAFYYLSCTPWVEFKHKRKRRREAEEQAHERIEIVVTQPGRVRQPAPFQTNEAWAEELILGPGPPKGWKKDTLLQKLQNKLEVHREPREPALPSAANEPESPSLKLQPTSSSTRPSSPSTEFPAVSSTRPSSTTGESEENCSDKDAPPPSPSRAPLERRLSNAVENFKESLRTSLHPPKWNWTRYDREDEILAGFTERVTRMWNRATAGVHHEEPTGQEQTGESSTYKRKRALTNESERYDYNRARHPEVNDMHPPVVSQLPATRAEAAWMLLPPPSAAVMEARTRPAAEPEMRWPLCVIGRPPKDTDRSLVAAKTRSREYVDVRDFGHASDSADEENSMDHADEMSEEESHGPDEAQVGNTNLARTKHWSDPIIKPPLIHPASRLAGELFLPKRRDSWQFHYVVPSKRPTDWRDGMEAADFGS